MYRPNLNHYRNRYHRRFVFAVSFCFLGWASSGPIVFNLLQLDSCGFSWHLLSAIVWIGFKYLEASPCVFSGADFLQLSPVFFNSAQLSSIFNFLLFSWFPPPNAFNCLQMSPVVFNWLQVFRIVLNCLQLRSIISIPIVPNCLQLSSIISNYLQLASIVYNCLELSSNIPHCVHMPPIVFNLTMVSHCLQFSRHVLNCPIIVFFCLQLSGIDSNFGALRSTNIPWGH